MERPHLSLFFGAPIRPEDCRALVAGLVLCGFDDCDAELSEDRRSIRIVCDDDDSLRLAAVGDWFANSEWRP